MSDHPKPQLLELAQPGHYILPIALSSGGLAASRGAEPARIRLVLGHATILDIPVTPRVLGQLAEDLVPYLHPKREVSGEQSDS